MPIFTLPQTPSLLLAYEMQQDLGETPPQAQLIGDNSPSWLLLCWSTFL